MERYISDKKGILKFIVCLVIVCVLFFSLGAPCMGYAKSKSVNKESKRYALPIPDNGWVAVSMRISLVDYYKDKKKTRNFYEREYVCYFKSKNSQYILNNNLSCSLGKVVHYSPKKTCNRKRTDEQYYYDPATVFKVIAWKSTTDAKHKIGNKKAYEKVGASIFGSTITPTFTVKIKNIAK